MTADDAFALADALERALCEIPSDASKQDDQTVYLSPENQAKDALLKRFVGDEDYLQEFISFCREGGFNIYWFARLKTQTEQVKRLIQFIVPHDQGDDRAHRMGQTETVFSYYFAAENTIDEKMLRMIENKRALAATITGAPGGDPEGSSMRAIIDEFIAEIKK